MLINSVTAFAAAIGIVLLFVKPDGGGALEKLEVYSTDFDLDSFYLSFFYF